MQFSHHVLLPCPAYTKDRLQRCDGALRFQDTVFLRPLQELPVMFRPVRLEGPHGRYCSGRVEGAWTRVDLKYGRSKELRQRRLAFRRPMGAFRSHSEGHGRCSRSWLATQRSAAPIMGQAARHGSGYKITGGTIQKNTILQTMVKQGTPRSKNP